MLTVLWADQEPVPADDRGLAYGDGLFETIRIEGRRPLLLARHLARLVRGAEVLDIPLDQAALGGALGRPWSAMAAPVRGCSSSNLPVAVVAADTGRRNPVDPA